MCYKYSLNYFWQTTSQEWAVLFEKWKTNTFSRSCSCISTFISISTSYIRIILSLWRVSPTFCCALCHSLRCNLFFFIFLAHQAHSSKLTSNIIYLLSSKLMCLTYFSDFFCLQHSTSFVWVFIFTSCSSSLRWLSCSSSYPIIVLSNCLFSIKVLLWTTIDVESYFTLLVHTPSSSISTFNGKSTLCLRK